MIHTIALTGVQLSQLLALDRKSLTFAGDTLSKDVVKDLRDHGLVTLMEGWYTLTGRGSALAKHFKGMIYG